MTGHTLGHCRIAEKIDVREVCEVYCAHGRQLDCDVALKVLPPGTTAGETARPVFSKESRALPKRNHPNIETVFELSTQDGTDFLAPELIPVNSLPESAQIRTACHRSCLSPG